MTDVLPKTVSLPRTTLPREQPHADPKPAPVAPPTGPPPADKPRDLHSRTIDDRASVIGAACGSLGLSWLVYTQVLLLSGFTGFLITWYVVFVLIYAAVTAVGNPWPVVKDRIASAMLHAGAALVGLCLALTVIYTALRGAPALPHVDFYTKDMSGVPGDAPLDQGGILHALVGSLIEVAIAIVVSLPLGIVTAVYMTEVGGRLSRIVRTMVEAMTAVPDILAGLFIYTTLIVAFNFPKSGFAAGLAISVTMVPIIARAADVVLRVVPGGLREAGLALGASQVQVVFRVVLPTALPGLATALILAVARGIGETAPVLLTSGASTFLNWDPFHYTMNSLPLYIFTAVRSGQPDYITRGFGAAIVLLVLVLVLFAVTRWLARPRVGRR
ncbi:phosphate ABC transporter permease PstA [Dactylosporangium salmoneum]|uniref:Phosphate transport system permease protein PstA n=1 Tax=Dactylosporangium salmoneum TaxID=53361 RepID=A0ABN3G804_9ACTN